MRSIWMPAATALAIVVTLTGCHSEAPVVIPTAAPTSTPVFANDEEALAAATKAYGEYLAVSNQIAADGGTDVERIDAVVAPSFRDESRKSFDSFVKNKTKTSGSGTFDSTKLQMFDDGTIRIYLCFDVSKVKVVNASGKDVTPANRPDRIPLEVGFDLTNDQSEPLLSSSDVWDETAFCDR